MDTKDIKIGDIVKFRTGFWGSEYGEITKTKMILESFEKESNEIEYEIEMIGGSNRKRTITQRSIINVYKNMSRKERKNEI